VGYNGITALQVANRLTEKLRKKRDVEQVSDISNAVAELKSFPTRKKRESGVRVEGIENLLIRLSRCCNPVPGDDIVGFITKGRGVSVHRKDCPNLITDDAKERLIPVEWESGLNDRKEYHVEIEITGYDRRGVLNEVLQAVNETKTDISAVSGRTDRNKMVTITMSISIVNVSHLQKIVERIKQIPDLYSVRRIMN
ncbi:MAG TPA: ACT domain-containing protein, partial [Bacillus sp. (in: firmicutes)]|nr:ACT domain-containing protein [Bacillus sp. (in: firmicutes)]